MMKNLKRSYQRLFAVLSIMVMMVTAVPAYAEGTGSDSAGRYITVDNNEMHVVMYGDLVQSGNETAFADPNKTTIVMIPGLAEESPHLSFKPLAQALDTDFNIVIMEPLGYGLSDTTSASRSVENINKELNEALDALEINKCVLLVHSISGVYGLNFAQDYPERLKGFIAVDNTVYDEVIRDELVMESEYTLNIIKEFNEVKNTFPTLEAFQAAIKADPSKYGVALPQVNGYTYPESDLEEYIEAYSRSYNETTIDEVTMVGENLLTVKDKKFPDSLPVLMLVSSANVEFMPVWETAHRSQLNPDSANHQMYILEGEHYIWHKNLNGVVDHIKQWKTEFEF